MFSWDVLLLLIVAFAPPSHKGSSISHTIITSFEEYLMSVLDYNCTESDDFPIKCSPSCNLSTCCSLGPRNTERPLCAPIHQTPCQPNSAPSECRVRIPASRFGRKRSVMSYELTSCVGSNVLATCDVPFDNRDVIWRRDEDGEWTTAGRHMRIKDVQRADTGDYLCEGTDVNGKRRIFAKLFLFVEFPPVTELRESEGSLECWTQADPPAHITWFADDALLSNAKREEGANCSIFSRLRPDGSHNYTCIASNQHGRAFATRLWIGEVSERRRFNVTGFIVGMLPPLFISFYIILKLGYRSRYAEERGEDDGFRDEPFFIGY